MKLVPDHDRVVEDHVGLGVTLFRPNDITAFPRDVEIDGVSFLTLDESGLRRLVTMMGSQMLIERNRARGTPVPAVDRLTLANG